MIRLRRELPRGVDDVQHDDHIGEQLFMRRLAALVLRPRLHLIRFHGALAPNAGLRAAIVPGPAQNISVPAHEHAPGAPARMGWARLAQARVRP